MLDTVISERTRFAGLKVDKRIGFSPPMRDLCRPDTCTEHDPQAGYAISTSTIVIVHNRENERSQFYRMRYCNFVIFRLDGEYDD